MTELWLYYSEYGTKGNCLIKILIWPILLIAGTCSWLVPYVFWSISCDRARSHWWRCRYWPVLVFFFSQCWELINSFVLLHQSVVHMFWYYALSMLWPHFTIKTILYKVSRVYHAQNDITNEGCPLIHKRTVTLIYVPVCLCEWNNIGCEWMHGARMWRAWCYM